MIECVNPLSDRRWDAAIASSPEASFFHTSTWARVLHETYSFSPTYFMDGPEISDGSAGLRPAAERVTDPRSRPSSPALLPMMEIDSWLTGRRGASLPFTDECEPLCADPEAFSSLFKTAITHGKSRRWRSIEFRGGHGWPAPPRPAVTFYGHRLDFAKDPVALFNQLDSSVRRAVRKAEQSGLTVEFSTSLATMRDFYHLLGKTRQRHGVPPQPFRFFENIQHHVLAAGKGTLVLARQGSVPVAGAVYLHSGKTVIYKFGASDEAFQHLRGNNLVMWRAIEWFARNGFEGMDFGRTSLGNDGLRRFKLSWGTTERSIHYFKYDLSSDSFVTSHDQASGWHNRVFRILPRSVSQWIGTALYKHIA